VSSAIVTLTTGILEARMIATAPLVLDATVADNGDEGANGEVEDSPPPNDDV
jgi:hypothetical protein